MAKTELLLARLNALSPENDEFVPLLRQSLLGGNGVVAARAAELAKIYHCADLAAELDSAFQRFMQDPAKTDKGCLAKVAIVEALRELAPASYTVFMTGIHHVQMEPVYGGKADMAGPLREACAYALGAGAHPEAHYELSRLLLDPEPGPRLAAARALSGLPGRDSELVLQMKVFMGDERADVMGECFGALLSMNPRFIPLVVNFLQSPDLALVEEAALALGQSRKETAFELLHDAYEEAFSSHHKQILLLPMALTRTEESFAFLIDLVANAHVTLAVAAVKALNLYAADAPRTRQIQEAAHAHSDRRVAEIMRAEFNSR